MPNHLAREQSPYLLQHKDNPVDWYPWGDGGVRAGAPRRDKPIFLSIGYSTCHWCHVMEHESFENDDVAAVLNRDFVSIKVDREERPDVDRVYMTFVQSTTGVGRLADERVAHTRRCSRFTAAPTFRRPSKWGRPGFIDMLQEIARVWGASAKRCMQSAATIVDRAAQRCAAKRDAAGPSRRRRARPRRRDSSRQSFDAPTRRFRRRAEVSAAERAALSAARTRAHGRGRAARHGARRRCGRWRLAACATTSAADSTATPSTATGGCRTSRRCCTTRRSSCWPTSRRRRSRGDPLYLDVALDTLEYVRRDLTDPDGGFYSAEDADSVPPEHAADPKPHKTEGAFYIWRDARRLARLLGDDARHLRLRYGVLPGGNAPFDPQSEFTGKNLLYTARADRGRRRRTGRSAPTRCRSRSSAHGGRSSTRASNAAAAAPRRQGPHRLERADDCGVCARRRGCCWREPGGTAAPGGRYLDDARRAAAFMREHLWDAATGTLLRRYRAGRAGRRWIRRGLRVPRVRPARALPGGRRSRVARVGADAAAAAGRAFWDAVDGGWFSTTGRDASVLLRLKEDYDGAEPAASSVSVLNLLVLSHLVGDTHTALGASE